MRTALGLAIVCVTLFVAGCGDGSTSSEPMDSGTTIDIGPRVDGATSDGGASDGATDDGSTSGDDAGTSGDDAGTTGDDAGTTGDDAGTSGDDASTSTDAGAGCTSPSDCGRTMCATDPVGRCLQISPTCSSDGTCGSASTTTAGACDIATGTCVGGPGRDAGVRRDAGGTCSVPADCGAARCSNLAGGACLETTPTCAFGFCSSTTTNHPGTRCDATSGMCTGTGPRACTVDCDCAQGLMCVAGTCLAGFVPTYCCAHAGCPMGSSCSNLDGTRGTCP